MEVVEVVKVEVVEVGDVVRNSNSSRPSSNGSSQWEWWASVISSRRIVRFGCSRSPAHTSPE